MDNNQPVVPTEPQQPAVSAPIPTSTPPAGPQPQPPTVLSASPQTPKKSRKGLIIGSIIAGALVLFGGGGALAYNLWYQNPEKVIFDAITHAMTAKSATGKGEISLKSDEFALKVTFDGENSGSDGRVNAKVKMEGESDGESLAIDVTASVLIKGETLYFKLDNVQKTIDSLMESAGSETPEYFTPIVEKIDGQWVSVKASDYEDLSEETAKEQKCLTDLAEKLSNNKDMKKELTSLYRENSILVIDEHLKAKSINGVSSLGYEISGDIEALQGFIRGLDDTELGKGLKKCDDSIDFDDAADAIEDATKDDSSDSDVKTTVELWVSRFGHRITELNMTIKDDEAIGTFVFNPMFNEDVTIDAPSKAITIMQLQKDIEKAMEEYVSALYDQDPYSSDELDYEEYSTSYNLN